VDGLTLDRLKQALFDAGLEIYRATASEIRIAERVRMHLMDSGVAVSLRSGPQVTMTVRSQRSDFPGAPAELLFDKVRSAVGKAAEERGFRELSAVTRDITDPVDESHVLDVWHELTLGKDSSDVASLVDDVRWALRIPKCVDP
jgi:hypothetical protein